jgi:hypothetical protein
MDTVVDGANRRSGHTCRPKPPGALALSSLDEREGTPRRSPRRPSPKGPSVDRQTLMVRRSIAGGAVILVLILLVFGVRGCLDARQERAYKDYAGEVAELAQSSKQQSDAFFGLLRSGGGGAVEVEQQVNGFRAEAETLVERAQDADPPGELEEANRYFVDTLEFRRDAIAQIGDLIPSALGDDGANEAVQQIATQMLQFLASDVIYVQRVVPNLQGPLEEEEVLAEVSIAPSQFLPDTDWLRTTTVADRINRIKGGGGSADGEVAPGLHGTGVTGVTVQPGGQSLAAGGAVELTAAENLAFDVQVQNQGENEERDVVVRVTISGAGRPLEFEERIDTIAAGATETVRIAIADAPPTGRPLEVRVETEPVPGEEKTDNNSLSGRAVFSE